ncbi:MAG: hypothetical protein ACP5VE_06290 [Chthonomonadales bacterium]
MATTGSGGRIVCPRCGANNFDTVTVCWKCGAPLSARRAASPPRPPAGTVPPAADFPGAMGYAVSSHATDSNRTTANRAALWLGLLMPYFGLPIALAFLMCDDPRRQEVGRICLMWSLISGFLHFLFGMATLLGLREWFQMAFNAFQGQMGRRSGFGLEAILVCGVGRLPRLF